jgi:hypothetical protein
MASYRLSFPRCGTVTLSFVLAMSVFSTNALAQAKRSPPKPMSRVAYVYLNNKAAADSFGRLLGKDGCNTVLVPLKDIAKTDFTTVSLILIGSDTQRKWDATQSKLVDKSKRPIIALGEGGYYFLGKLKLAIGSPRGWHGAKTGIQVIDRQKSKFWNSPHVTVPKNESVKLYESSGHVGIHLPMAGGEIQLIGRETDNATHYPIVQQGPRHILWGFTESPDRMTKQGQQLFVETCRYLEAHASQVRELERKIRD